MAMREPTRTSRKPLLTGVALCCIASGLIAPDTQARETDQNEAAAMYFPGYGSDWQRRDPGDVGMNAELVQRAIRFSQD
ncbi:MAG: hypothetical protein EA423_12740, partial [Phycisphaerales bacterium]